MGAARSELPETAPHVLVVDDDRRLRDLLSRYLAEQGFRVTSAASAAEARAKAQSLLFDAMVLPTAPTAYSVEDVLANPIELNSRLGTYTNFVNLLDMCGLALPAAMRADVGTPWVTLSA